MDESKKNQELTQEDFEQPPTGHARALHRALISHQQTVKAQATCQHAEAVPLLHYQIVDILQKKEETMVAREAFAQQSPLSSPSALGLFSSTPEPEEVFVVDYSLSELPWLSPYASGRPLVRQSIESLNTEMSPARVGARPPS